MYTGVIDSAMQWNYWSCNWSLEVHGNGLPKMELNCNKRSVMQLQTPCILKTNFIFNNQDYTEYLVPVLHNCFLFQMNFRLTTRLRKLSGEFKCKMTSNCLGIYAINLVTLHQAFC